MVQRRAGFASHILLAVGPLVALILASQSTAVGAQAVSDEPVQVDVNLGQIVGELKPIWAYLGYDEGNYTYTPDGRKLLSDYAALTPGPVYVRAHNLLNTHEGSPLALKWGSTDVYTEDEDGNPVYDWTMMDRIVDTWIDRGMRPLMEIGFMPEALTTYDGPYRHYWTPGDPYGDIYTGWAYPPNDYEKWAELIYQWVRHSVERYGAEEVETWYWQLWNEPNIPYWQGSREEYFELYDYTADALKRALPTARIGGPETAPAGNAESFIRDFLEHARSGTNYATGETGSPVDFYGFHAKGSPDVTDEGHVEMDMGDQLEMLDIGFALLEDFPEYQDLPIILGESDPEGCAACATHFGYPDNDYRNGTMFSSYTASSFAKKMDIADRYGVDLQGAVSWTFTFPDQPLFAGFRAFSTTHGINKPVLNVMRMFGMMSGDRVEVTSESGYSAWEVIENGVGGEPDINGLASRNDNEVAVMVWNYHDDDVPAPASDVRVSVHDLPTEVERVRLHHYRIDEEHSNAYTVWLEMGGPQQLSRRQLNTLQDAGQLELFSSPRWMDVSDGTADVSFSLPRHGVSLLVVTW